MKSGLMIYHSDFNPCGYDFFNVGDYIQSLATKQFFEEIDIYIDRENLHKYQGEDLKLIMNGWYMHNPENWPPSGKINPLLIAFHLNSWTGEKLLNREGLEFFKKGQPVGCRDQYTVDILRSKGIDAYFSGCLTLTLGLTYKREKKDNKIYFVEPFYKLTRKNKRNILFSFKTLITQYRTVNKLNKKITGINTLTQKIKTAFFLRTYSALFDKDVLLNAEYIYQMAREGDFVDEDAKFKYADSLLKKYCSAQFVITSRIHCALPCLGMEVPVLYVYDKNQIHGSSSRLDGMFDLLHIIDYNNGKLFTNIINFKKRKISRDYSFHNKKEYLNLKESLIHKCNSYISQNK